MCSAQQKELDSLLILLKSNTTGDTTQLDLLNDVAFDYSFTDPTKGLEYAGKAISLAQKLNNRSKLASAFSNKGVNYSAGGNDSMALEYYHKALAIHQSDNSKKGIAIANNNIGLIFFNSSDYVKALEYHSKTLATFKELNDDVKIAFAYQNIGVDYQYLSDYPKALDYYLKALRIAERIKNKSLQANLFGNIGLVYKNFAAYNQALQYQQKALNINRALGNKQGEANTLGNIGVVYNLLEKYDTSLSYYRKALAINQQVGSQRRIASDIANMGILYKDTRQYASSIQYLKKALAIYEGLDDKNNIAIMLTSLGDIFRLAPNSILREVGISPDAKFTLALEYQNRALQLSKDIQAVDRQSEVWEALGKTYETKNDFANALMAYKNYTVLHDSIIGDEKKQVILQKAMQFNFEKKEDSLSIEHQKKVAINNAEIQYQKRIKRLIIFGAVFLLLAAIVSFVFYKRKKEAEQHKKEAELKAEVSDIEMKALRAQMNPHFIFNSLNSISDFIARNEHEKADAYLTQFAKLIRKTLENSEKKLIPLTDDLKVLEMYLQLEGSRLKDKFEYTIKIAADIDAENTMIPPLILQPFVENSIWHGFANKKEKGNITISISRQGEMLHCIIDDDGMGRKSFLPPINNNKNESLGMKITKARIDIMNKMKKSNGTVELSDLAIGMRVKINLPLELNF